jgi:hypothetical protein
MWSFLYGVFVGAVCTVLIVFALESRIIVPWYTWVLFVLALVLTALTAETAIGSRREREPRAMWMSLATLGTPSAVLWAGARLALWFAT